MEEGDFGNGSLGINLLDLEFDNEVINFAAVAI